MGILLCDDLIFSSRITAEARACGVELRSVRTVADLVALCAKADPRCIILDLSLTSDIGAAVAMIRSRATKPYIVAYGSHVDAALLKSARTAGCDVVLPRSKFVEQLPTELPRWFSKDEHRVSDT